MTSSDNTEEISVDSFPKGIEGKTGSMNMVAMRELEFFSVALQYEL